MPVNDPNTFPAPGILDATLRPFYLALSRWLKKRLDATVSAGSNAKTGFQGQLRSYAVPALVNNPQYTAGDGNGQWLISIGVPQVAFNASGDGTITFPIPFPNGISCAVAFAYDAGQQVLSNNSTWNRFGMGVKRHIAAAANIYVSYIAFGY